MDTEEAECSGATRAFREGSSASRLPIADRDTQEVFYQSMILVPASTSDQSGYSRELNNW